MNKPARGNQYFFLILISLFIGGIIVTLSISDPIYVTPALEFGFIFVPTVIILLIRGNIKENIMLKWIKLKDFLLVFLVGALSIVIVLCINIATSDLFHNFVSDSVGTLSQLSLLKIMLILALTPTICEELFFRGLLLSQYRNISIHKAALINGFFFGLFHMNFNQFLYTFSLGVIMVYVVAITRSILSSMIMHFMLNGFSAYNLWRSASKVVETSPEPSTPVTLFSPAFWSIITILVVLIFIVSNILIAWAKSKNVDFNQPVSPEKSLEDDDFRNEYEQSGENKIFDIWILLSVGFFILNVLLTYGLTGSF